MTFIVLLLSRKLKMYYNIIKNLATRAFFLLNKKEQQNNDGLRRGPRLDSGSVGVWTLHFRAASYRGFRRALWGAIVVVISSTSSIAR